MNNLDVKILQALQARSDEGLLDVFQTISYKISNGISPLSDISKPFYAAVLQQYADALMNDMDETDRGIAESLIQNLNGKVTCAKILLPKKGGKQNGRKQD